MKLITTFAKISVLALLLAACAGGGAAYHWGGYNFALLDHYKDGTEPAALAARLQEAVDQAEDLDKVPPGLYAELGYAYLEADNAEQAVFYFQKEMEKWPESEIFMTEIIARVGG